MTHTVSSGTLNPSIPYHTIPQQYYYCYCCCDCVWTSVFCSDFTCDNREGYVVSLLCVRLDWVSTLKISPSCRYWYFLKVNNLCVYECMCVCVCGQQVLTGCVWHMTCDTVTDLLLLLCVNVCVMYGIYLCNVSTWVCFFPVELMLSHCHRNFIKCRLNQNVLGITFITGNKILWVVYDSWHF